jgi:hypothetical protein
LWVRSFNTVHMGIPGRHLVVADGRNFLGGEFVDGTSQHRLNRPEVFVLRSWVTYSLPMSQTVSLRGVEVWWVLVGWALSRVGSHVLLVRKNSVGIRCLLAVRLADTMCDQDNPAKL